MIVESNTVKSEYKKLYSLKNKKIGIPIFQRFYAWKPQQTAQLLEDISDLLKGEQKQLYLLDFICYYEDDKLMLADGQQRLITINNLIKAIKDVSSEQNKVIDYIDYFDVSYEIIKNNEKYLNHLNNYPTAPFKKVYLELKSFVNDNINQVDKLIRIIKNNIYIYLKTCANPDDAFKIFQQINTGGKPLTKDEVIKTALDQYAKAYEVDIDTSKIKDIKQVLISYYKFEKDDVDKNFDNIEIITFIKEYITKDKKSFSDFSKMVDLISRIQKHPLKYVINYINRSTLCDILYILAMKRIDIDMNKEYMEKVLLPLCITSIVFSLKNVNPTSFKYLLGHVIKEIKNNKKPQEIQMIIINYINGDSSAFKITKNELMEKLRDPSKNYQNIKKAILIIDIVLRNVSGSVNVDSINLEHIYPQHPDDEWAVHGWPTNVDEQNSIINNMGNYILLCESVNKKIQNGYILSKKQDYEKIIAKDKILQTEINTVDFDRFEKEKLSYINERLENMCKLIQELPLGQVLIKEE